MCLNYKHPSECFPLVQNRHGNNRYQRGNQNPYIEEEQKTQWQKKKYKRTNNDLQNMHIKLKIEKHEPHYKPG
jgi:hypothetical protein